MERVAIPENLDHTEEAAVSETGLALNAARLISRERAPTARPENLLGTMHLEAPLRPQLQELLTPAHRLPMVDINRHYADDPEIKQRMKLIQSRGTPTHNNKESPVIHQLQEEASRFKLLGPAQEQKLGKAMIDGILALQALRTHEDPPIDYRYSYDSQLRDAAYAYQVFVNCNMRLVISIARDFHYADPNQDLEDFIQNGSLGLQRAAQKFDYRKGVKFSTYTSPWIKTAISRANTNESRAIHLPEDVERLARKVVAIDGAMYRASSERPSLEVIAEELRITPEYVADLRHYIEQQPVSYHVPYGYEGSDETLLDYLTPKTVFEPILHEPEAAALADELLRSEHLIYPQRVVLGLRHGVADRELMDEVIAIGERSRPYRDIVENMGDGLTAGEIGEQLGMKKHVVTHLINQATEILQSAHGDTAETELTSSTA
jgi:RNA polymerase sigma factor (sigma-70 family)